MKEAEWHALCRREHEQGREVTGLTLTAASAQELAAEILSYSSADTDGSGARRMVAGARVGKVVNWSADTVIRVEVNPDAGGDVIAVRGTDGVTRLAAVSAPCS